MVKVLLVKNLPNGYIVVQYYSGRYVVHNSAITFINEIPHVHFTALTSLYEG